MSDIREAQDSAVHSPRHYRSASGREVIDIVEQFGFSGSWHLADALVYIMRAGKKGAPEQDRAKAAYYLNRWIDDPNDSATLPSDAKTGDHDDAECVIDGVISDFGLTGVDAEATRLMLEFALDGGSDDDTIEQVIAVLGGEA